jgi:lantibiotic modifying enzyme
VVVVSAPVHTRATPIEGATRVGRSLAASAIRHGGRCTWVADELVAADYAWRPRGRTLGPDLASGRAGVGWFLARLAHAVDDDVLANVASEALRASLDDVDALLADGRLGFYDGALGIAWAALDAGRALGIEELADHGREVATTAGERSLRPSASPTMFGGDAGLLTGLLVLAELTEEQRLIEAGAAVTENLIRVATELAAHALRGGAPRSSDGRSFVGVAEGASGLAVPLLGFARETGDPSTLQAAADAALAERVWLSASGDWIGLPFHRWQDQATAVASWCSGMTGIGHARLLEHQVTGGLQALAEVAAAVEVVRGTLAAPHPPEPSLCHGIAGWLDFMLTAGVALHEPAHLEAAERVGARLLALVDVPAGAAGEAPADPSLLLGAAGTGLALLRLHDPEAIRSPANPLIAETRS